MTTAAGGGCCPAAVCAEKAEVEGATAYIGTMARDKNIRNKNEPKRHLLPAMSVRKPPAPIPRVLVCLWWNETTGRNEIRVRPNPAYSKKN